MTTQSLPIASIRRDGGTQTRASVNEERADHYAERMRAGDEFPAPVVFSDGATYWLADGFHRIEAADRIGRTHVDVEVREGGAFEAFLFGLDANAKHDKGGLYRSNADKRHSVVRLFEWLKSLDRDWTDLRIANACGVSHVLVQEVRRSTEESSVGPPRPREAADGRLYKPKPEQPATKPRTTPPSPPPSDAPNPFVAVRSAIAFARTSADLATAADELARYEERGSLSPKEAAELRSAYTVASTRVLLDDKPTPPGGRARKVVLDDEEGAAARVRATPVDPPEGANDDDEDDESAPGQVFEAADEPEVRREPEHDRWGSFDVSSHVLKVIGACKSAEASIGALFAAVDPRFSGEVRQRCQDSVLRLMRSLDALLPPDGRMAESNRKTFEVIKGGV